MISNQMEQDLYNINPSSFEAPSMVIIVVVVVVVVGIFLVNHIMNVTKFIQLAWNIDGSFMIKSILFLSLLQQLHKQWVIYVDNRDYDPLLLLSLTHHDRQAPFWYVSQLFLPLMMMMVQMNVWDMKMKTYEIFISKPHLN